MREASCQVLRRIGRPLAYLLLGLAATAWGQPPGPTVTLEAALARGVPRHAAVLAARADLSAAEREAERVLADPFALRLPKLQAEGALAAAREALGGARLRAQTDVQDAFFGALGADGALRLAVQGHALAQRVLAATEVRFEAGAVLALDVERARNELRAAERSLREAETRRTLAHSTLAAQLGAASQRLQLHEPSATPPLPDLAAVLERLPDNAEVRRAERAVTEARVSLEGVDNAFSARAEVEAARAAFEDAQVALTELRASLEAAVRAEVGALAALESALEAAEASYATERAALQIARARFAAGNVSELELAQTALDTATSAAAVRAARFDLARAVLAFESTLQGGMGGLSAP